MEMRNSLGAAARRVGLALLLSCGMVGIPVQAQQLPALPVPVPAADSPLPMPDLGLFGSLLQLPGLALPSLPMVPLSGSLLNLGNTLDLTLLQASGELVLACTRLQVTELRNRLHRCGCLIWTTHYTTPPTKFSLRSTSA